MKKITFFVFLACVTFIKVQSQVKINELQAINTTTIQEPVTKSYPDWIELYNGGTTSVDLSGYYITDDPDAPKKYKLPEGTSIAAKSYLLVWADDKNTGVHTNFRLGSEGSTLVLYSPTMFLVDSCTYPTMDANGVFGRIADGTGAFNKLLTPTPGAKNSPVVVKGKAPKPLFSKAGGFYSSAQTINLTTTLAGATIRYTTDGSEPTAESPAYNGSITLDKETKVSQKEGDRAKKTGIQRYSYPSMLSYPADYYTGDRDYARVLKAKVFHPDYLASNSVAHTYFIDMRKPSLPVVSLSTDYANYFSADSGIYIQGTNGIADARGVKANWHQDWERPTYFEFYDEQGQRKCGVKLGTSTMGAVSRNWDMKSLNVVTRNDYEEGDINFPIFKKRAQQSYKSVLLRNSGNDWDGGNMARDGIIHSVVKDQLDVEFQEYQPAVVYLNGEYFGLENLRERQDQDYYAAHYKHVNPKEVDILKVQDYGIPKALDGDTLYYSEMIKYITAANLADEAQYEFVKNNYIDVDAYINYIVVETYSANGDWPNNNVKLWRPRMAKGKFRWSLFDLDFGYGLYGGGPESDHITPNVTTGGNSRPSWSTIVLRRLLANPGFKNEFVQRYAYHINTVFDPARLKAIADATDNMIANERDNFSDEEWTRKLNAGREISSMVTWGEKRPDYVRSHINKNFGSKGWATLTVNADVSRGKVYLCTMPVSDGYSGLQYKSTPIRLQAVPADGYRFVKWIDGDGEQISTSTEYFLTITDAYNIEAIFESQPTLSKIYINEFMADNEQTILDETGKSNDWVELYNGNADAVDVGGLYLSDSSNKRLLYQIPKNNPTATTIPAGGFLLLWTDDQPHEGTLHLPFKLNRQKGYISLSQKLSNGTVKVLDSLSYMYQNTDISMGHYPDGSPNKTIFTLPTPGESNEVQSVAFIDGLKITEIMTRNKKTITDETGRYGDWIEIFNSTSSAIDLGGLFVTDDPKNLNKYMIPRDLPDQTTVAAKGYYILWADKQPLINPNHLDFNLASDKGFVAISQLRASANYIIDQVMYSNQGQDIAYGVFPANTGTWRYLTKATPGSANLNDTTITPVNGLTINEALAINTNVKMDEYGEYEDYIEIYNGTSNAINMGGLFLSDTLSHTLMCRITSDSAKATTVQPGQWITFWADDQPKQGARHLEFKLSSTGEEISLCQVTENGIRKIDSLDFGIQTPDVSFGCFPEKSRNVEAMTPTFNAKNTSSNDIALLKSITPSVGSLSGTLYNDIFNYKILVPNGTTQAPALSAVPISKDATISIVQANAISDIATITVISPSGLNTQVYIIKFAIELSNDAGLKSLVVSNSTLSPAFSPSTLFYNATTTSQGVPLLTAVPNNGNAQVSISYATSIRGNTVVRVVAESGQVQEYTISYSFVPTELSVWTDNFDDNTNTNLVSSSTQYAINETNEEMFVHFTRPLGGEWATYMTYNIPSNFVVKANPNLKVSFDAHCNLADNKYLGTRIEVIDANGHSSNLTGEIATIPPATDHSAFEYDFSGDVEYDDGTPGLIDKNKIVGIRIYFDYQNNTSAKNKRFYMDNLKIGNIEAAIPSSNALLATLKSNLGTLSPAFASSTTAYTLVLPAGTTTIPVISATAQDAGAEVQVSQSSTTDGQATVRVMAADHLTSKTYTIDIQVSPTVVEGYVENIVRPQLPGWSVSSNTYSLAYNSGSVDVTYNRTATSGNSYISFNLANEAAKILNLKNYPLFALEAKTSTDIALRADLFDESGYITSATPVVKTINGSSSTMYIFDFAGKFNQATPLATVNSQKIYGVRLYFDAGSTSPKSGLVMIEKLLFGSEVKFAVNMPPTIATLPSQSIVVGQSFNNILLNNFVSDDRTPASELTWTASATSNITVSIANNVVTVQPKLASWIGSETVTFTATDSDTASSSKTATFTVTELNIPVSSVAFTSASVSLGEKETLDLNNLLLIKPLEANVKSIHWSSNNTKLNVSTSGEISHTLDYGVAMATITVVVTDNSNNSFTRTISVAIAGCDNLISEAILSPHTIEILELASTQLNISKTPVDACTRSISYLSRNTQVATVSATGLVKGLVPGTSTVVMTIDDGVNTFIDSCLVTVKVNCEFPITLSLNKKSLTLEVGQKDTLLHSVTPANICTTGKTAFWTSSNTAVATVNNGVISAIGVGQALIICQTEGNGKTSDTCSLSVIPNCFVGPVTMQLSKNSDSLFVGQESTITATVGPEKACDKSVLWSSSNVAVASVSGGVITAQGWGSATITCKSVSHPDVISTVSISVVKRLPQSISAPASLKLEEGNMQTITASILPSNTEETTVTWSSSNEAVATVSAGGLVKAVSIGECLVVATTANKLKDTCKVTVIRKVIALDSITVETQELALTHHETYQVEISFYPVNATNKDVIIASSNANKVSVEGNTLTATGVGSATITISSVDGGFSKTIEVTVSEKVVSSVELNKLFASITVGDTLMLSALVYPDDASNKFVSWVTNNSSIATVNAMGMVIGKKAGQTTISATSNNGVSSECVITVLPIVAKSISLDISNDTLAQGDSVKLVATILPANTEDKSVTWSSSNPQFAIVSATGMVHAMAKGTAFVSAKTANGLTVTATIVVIDNCNAPLVVSLSQSTLQLVEGKEASLVYSIDPANSCTAAKEVVWESSNTSVATVAAGIVKAVSAGEATITCQTDGNGTTSASCSVLVTPGCSSTMLSIAISKDTVFLSSGYNTTLKASILPSNLCDNSVVWTSSNTGIATVENGIVTALKEGTAIVKCSSPKLEQVYDSVLILIKKRLPSSVSIAPSSGMIAGSENTMSAYILPTDSEDKFVSWESTNSSVATITEGGVVSALTVGSTKIVASTVNGLTDTCHLSVTSGAVPVTGISVDLRTIAVVHGQSVVINLTFEPYNATNQEFNITSNNANVGINGLLLTGIHVGQSTLVLHATDGGFTDTITVNVTPILVSSISLDTSSVTLDVEDSLQLAASILPENASVKTLVWKSSNNAVATVNANGLVAAIQPGSTIISATSSNGIEASCQVVVNEVQAKSITLNASEISLFPDSSTSLSATILPSATADKSIVWQSTNTSVATVDAQGHVTAVQEGTAFISATTSNMISSSCKITVIDACSLPIVLSINEKSQNILKGKTDTLSYSITQSAACGTQKQVFWYSSNSSVASVSNGVVTAVSVGSAMIICQTAGSGSTSDTCFVSVLSQCNDDSLSITMSVDTVELYTGDQARINASVSPQNACDNSIVWSSTSSSVATVQNGMVTAQGWGQATVICRSLSHSDVMASTIVNVVKRKPASINILESIVLSEEASKLITVNILPLNTEDYSLSWVSTNTSVVSVNSKGTVTAIGGGLAEVIVTTSNGLSDTCLVEVNPVFKPVDSINVVIEKTVLTPGDSTTITVIVYPLNATNRNTSATSSNTAVATLEGNVIKAIAPGQTTITVSTPDNAFTKTFDISVFDINATKVLLNTGDLSLFNSDTSRLSAIILPANATNKKVSWFTSDSSVAIVDSTGLLTAIKPGTASIRAVTANGIQDTCKITVKEVVASNIILEMSEMKLAIGQSDTLDAEIIPENTYDKTISWSNVTPSVASVSSRGVITALSIGTTFISGITANGLTATCKVVVSTVDAKEVILSKTRDTISVYDTTRVFASVFPENSTSKTVTWSSSNTIIASVANGLVTGHKSGEALIIATVGSNVRDTFTIVVKDILPVSLSANIAQHIMNVDSTQFISVDFAPDNVTDRRLTFTSSNTDIATIDNKGMIVARSAGNVKITVTASNRVNTSFTITVTPVLETSITLNADTAILSVGENQHLALSFSPENVTNKTVTWISAAPGIATIKPDGLVTAIAPGITYVCASSSNGLSTCCLIDVRLKTVPVKTVVIDRDTVIIPINETEAIAASVFPDDAANKSLLWSSTKTSVAQVSIDGEVTAISEGESLIIASANNGVADTCVVKVVYVPVSSVTIAFDSLGMGIGQSQVMSALVEPPVATNKKLSWYSSDSSIISITSSGTSKTIKAGTAHLVAVSADGAKDSILVRVYNSAVAADSIAFKTRSLYITIDSTRPAQIVFYPASVSNKMIQWSIANNSIASVDALGNITALALGNTTLIARSANGKMASASINVVPVMATSISVSPSSDSLNIGETLVLKATVLPSSAHDKIVTWVSRKPTVASVSSNGVVTALEAGAAEIVAITGNDLEAVARVVVKPKLPTGITITIQSTTVSLNENIHLTYNLQPANASAVSVTWASSDSSIAAVDASGNVRATGYGTASVKVTTANGHSSSCTITVPQPNEAPVVASIPEQRIPFNSAFNIINLSLYVTDDNTEPSSIAWSVNTSTSKHLIFTIDGKGTARAYITDRQWVGTDSVVFIATDHQGLHTSTTILFTVENETGIDYTPSFSMVLYPNPSRGEFALCLKQQANSTDRTAEVTILDLTGTEVFRNTFALGNSLLAAIDISHCIPGTYLVVVKTKSDISYKQIIIK